MDSYRIQVKPSARHELEALPDNVLVRAIEKLESLASDPRPPGCRKLKGFRDHWRIRIRDWRIVYTIDDTAKVISVTRVGHRRDVYDR